MPAAPRSRPGSYPVKPAACHPFLKEGEVDARRVRRTLPVIGRNRVLPNPRAVPQQTSPSLRKGVDCDARSKTG